MHSSIRTSFTLLIHSHPSKAFIQTSKLRHFASMSTSTSASAWVQGPNKTSFYTKRWTAQEPKARLVFCHGIIEHIERYNHVFSAFADHGISVFAFDQRGFGRTAQKTKTQGMTTMTDQLRDLEFFLAAEAKEAKLADQKLYLMGHSMGGGIVLTYATRKDDRARPTLAKLDGLIASAPMIEQPPGFRANRLLLKVGGRVGWLLPSLQMKIDIKKDDLTHDPAVNNAYVKDPLCAPIVTYKGLSDMFKAGDALHGGGYKTYRATLPLLIYHGTGDRITSHDASKDFERRASINDKTFRSYPDYYHELHNELGDMKEKVISDVIGWITQRA